MDDIRQPDDWQVGDLAFCIDGGGRISKGDILKVTDVRDRTLMFGPGRGSGSGEWWHGAGRFARILTRDEMKALPEGAELYSVTSVLTGTHEPGFSFLTVRGGPSTPSYLYALKSLPEPKHEFKVGDWVQWKRSGDHLRWPGNEPRKVVSILEPTKNPMIEGVGAFLASDLTPITEAEAQRLLALKDIEDARALLADAERRLEQT